MTIDNLVEAAVYGRLLFYDNELWHVERVEIEQVDAVHRPTEAGGILNDYLNRSFNATLRHPQRSGITEELSGHIAPDRSVHFEYKLPTDKELQWEEMKEDRL